VQHASEQGDAVACRILERAAEELALGTLSVASRLEMRGDPFVCVLAGGVFRGVPWLAEELRRRLPEVAPRCHVQLLEDEPAVGAVRLALVEARGGTPVQRVT
jgi:N-acetylglucosamine kinase-like BadF-type ATPase